MKYFIKTMGCQMNVHDSEKIAGVFSESGYDGSEDSKNADVIVLNTCSIREKAEQKFFSELGRLKKVKKHKPHLKIAVAGCIAQQKGKEIFIKYPYVDFIFGPNNIDNLQSWIEASGVERRVSDVKDGQQDMSLRSTPDARRSTAVNDNPEYHTKILPMKRIGRVKAWVSIMYGCNNFCTYCVVPYTRGRERSRPPEDIYNEIQALADQGFTEVTLLGQNVNSYGKTLKGNIDFPDLLKKIHTIEKIRRIRFVTSHPRDFSDNLINTMKELPKVCRHLHLPVQSGSDRVLEAMNRGYTYDEYKNKIDLLKESIPGIAITTDIIAGFPGETEEDFDRTMTALSDVEYDGIFAFKYSRRPGTKALDLPDHINEEIKSGRLSQILKLQESVTFRKNKTLEGESPEILVESKSGTDPDKMTGRTGTNKIVNFCGDNDDIGKIIQVKILKARMHSLDGEKI
ncbi:MAG: tRNA (N6-isopentenyl adenosine(37)-C2)-methylthiotransferase MiaB [Nitrospirota bacterium]